MTNKIKIGIAEDHNIVRFGFVQLLSGYEDIRVVFQAKDGVELFEKLDKNTVDVILLDIKMPKIDGVQAIPRLRRSFPHTKIIVVSAYFEDDLILKYSNLGAHSFLAKVSDLKILVKAIYAVREKGFYYEDRILNLIREKGSFPLGGIMELTAKEKLVLVYLCEGRTTKEISKILTVSESTIAGYKHRIMQKTGTNDDAELFDFAVKNSYFKKN